ncbi:MAG: hypothetical protein IJK33_06290 [Clostridia bacterium]|nr:hypothetical protein [Clostridia bacterium]
MKRFLISALALAAMLALVCVSGARNRRRAEILCEAARGMTPQSAAEFEEKWKETRKRFALSVREHLLERVDGAACDAASAASAGDETAFITAKRRLVAALENIAGGDAWDFLNVF